MLLGGQGKAHEMGKSDENGLYLQANQQGAVPLYDLGRSPVTLYKEHRLKVTAHLEVIKHSILEHDSELSTKETRK